MFITFQELLQLKEMNQAKVAAGKNGLYRIITWYTISEIVDYKTDNCENKLVFIAGIGMKQYEDDLMKILHYICEKGVAGAVLEIGPFIPALPQIIADTANEMIFPILTLPFDVKISTVTYAMTQLLFSRQP